MPTYEYVCTGCKMQCDVTKPMSEFDRTEQCTECGSVMRRKITVPRVHADSYRRPIHSDALAIHPSQREEHMRLYPDVKLDEECRPILDSYTKHEKYLEARGIYKPPKRNKRRERRIL